jgi:hypothetical protein
LVLALQHRCEVETDAAHLDAVLGEAGFRFLVEVRRLQQRLRRDAADVEAGTAQRRPLFDACRAQAQLRRTDGRHVAAWPGADHHHIVLLVAAHSRRLG